MTMLPTFAPIGIAESPILPVFPFSARFSSHFSSADDAARLLLLDSNELHKTMPQEFRGGGDAKQIRL